MKQPVSQVRNLAVQVLDRVYSGAYSNLELNQVIRHSSLEPRDVRLLTRLVYGTLQHRLTFRYDLKAFLRHPRRLPQWLIILLEISLYQMFDLSKIPNWAILNEAIQIAKVRGNRSERRLVTGVLHNVIRKGVPPLSKIKDPLRFRSVKFSVPEWIIQQLDSQVGAKKCDSILRHVNQPKQTSIDVNVRLINQKALMNQLVQDHERPVRSHLAKNGLVTNGRPVAQTNEFKRGLFSIQAESAMLPVESMHIRPDEKILDTCSAPGGKTCQIAERLSKSAGGMVLACDLHPNRLAKVTQNAKQLRVNDCLRTQVADAQKLHSSLGQRQFDQILVDAPCSGLGLIRNKPEIRYFRQLSDVRRLHQIQVRILLSAANQLKVGGHLVYSTCTILDQENQATINAFLDRRPNYRLISTRLDLPINGRKDYQFVKLYPDDFDSDGFFICTLVRIK